MTVLAGVAAASPAGSIGILAAADKSDGEEREILERVDWFREARDLDDEPLASTRRAQAIVELHRRIASGVPRLLDAQNWLPLGPDGLTMLDWSMGHVAGRITALAVDPDDEATVYVGSAAGGLWKSTDGGGAWTSLFDQIGTESIGSILLEAGAPDHVWVGTGEADAGCLDYFGLGLFYSDDGGQTFVSRNGDGAGALTLSFVTAIAQSPADVQTLLVGGKGHCNENGALSGGGIYRSEDGGTTWTQTLTGSGVRDLMFDADDAAIVYAAVRAKGIYKSTDAGVTWTLLTDTLPVNGAATYGRLAMAPSDPSTLYALMGAASGASLSLYRSADAGATWTDVNDNACEGQCFYNLTLDVNPVDPEQVLVGTIRPALSTDGGTTLTILTAGWGGQQAVHQDTHIVRYSRNDGSRFWVGSDGGLWRSDDGGGTFANLNANLQITQFYDIALDPSDPRRLYGGAQDNSSSVRDDSDLWDVTAVTGDGFMNAVDVDHPERVFQTSYPNGGGAALILSTQHGAPDSFAGVSQTGLDPTTPFAWVTPLVTAGGAVFVASDRVYRATIQDDAGAYAWTDISGSLNGGTNVSISVLGTGPLRPGGGLRMVVGTANGRISATDDVLSATPQWTDITGAYPGRTVSDIAIDASDDSRVFVTRSVFQAPHLLGSVGGSDWQALGDGLPIVPANTVAIDPVDPQRLFVGTDIGVYESLDGGATFAPFMAGLPLGMVVTDLEIAAVPHVLVAATYGRGAWTVNLIDRNDVIFDDGFDAAAP